MSRRHNDSHSNMGSFRLPWLQWRLEETSDSCDMFIQGSCKNQSPTLKGLGTGRVCFQLRDFGVFWVDGLFLWTCWKRMGTQNTGFRD